MKLKKIKQKISQKLMFDNVQINQGIHQQNSFFISTFFRKTNLIIIQISKKRFETTINFIRYRPNTLLFMINYFVNNFISASENSGKICGAITCLFSYVILNIVVGAINYQDVRIKARLFGDFPDKDFAHGCYVQLLRNETRKEIAATVDFLEIRYLSVYALLMICPSFIVLQEQQLSILHDLPSLNYPEFIMLTPLVCCTLFANIVDISDTSGKPQKMEKFPGAVHIPVWTRLY